MWKADKLTDEYVETAKAQTLDELVSKLKQENLVTEDINENYSNGKAQVSDSTNSGAKIEFSYFGSRCEVISRANQNTAYIRISDNNVTVHYRVLDANEEEFQANVTGGVLDNLEYGLHSIEIFQSKKVEGVWENLFYVDAIKIYK